MGQGHDFLVKARGLSSIEVEYKHCFSLACICGFRSNNAVYSARLPFIMSIFLLTHLNTHFNTLLILIVL